MAPKTKPKAQGEAFAGAAGTVRHFGRLSAFEVAYWIVKGTPWRGEDAAKAIAVFRCESGLSTNAHAVSSVEDSWGVAQINLKAHTQVTPEQARDAETAVKIAHEIWSGAGNTFTRDWVRCSKNPTSASDRRAVEKATRATGGPGEAAVEGLEELGTKAGGALLIPFTHFIGPALKIAAGGIFILAALAGILAVAALAKSSRDVVRDTLPIARVGRVGRLFTAAEREARYAKREDRRQDRDVKASTRRARRSPPRMTAGRRKEITGERMIDPESSEYLEESRRRRDAA